MSLFTRYPIFKPQFLHSGGTINGDVILNGNLELNGSLTLGTFSQGSVLFTGSGGVVSEDSVAFSFNSTTDTLSVTNISATLTTTTNLVVTTGLTLPNNSVTNAMVVDSLTISGGTVDNSPIGATTPSTGAFTTLTSTSLTLSTFTQGSVLFAGAGGAVSQDNTNLYWDDVNNRLGVGTSTPAVPLHVYNTTAALTVQYPGASGKWGTLLAGPSGAGFGFASSGYFAIGRIGSVYETPTNDIVVNSSGRVGIGTGSPARPLQVLGEVNAITNVARGTSVGVTGFDAANSAAFPRAMVYGYSGSAITNFGFYAASGNATGTTQTPAFSGISTNATPSQANSIQGISYIDTTKYVIYTAQAENTQRAVPIYIGHFTQPDITVAKNTYIGLGNVTNPTARLSLSASTLASGGIAFGSDTNLYRSAADTLRTDDTFVVGTLLDLSVITAGNPSVKITATTDTPTTTWTAGVPSTDPAGYMEIVVGGNARYVPFWT